MGKLEFTGQRTIQAFQEEAAVGQSWAREGRGNSHNHRGGQELAGSEGLSGSPLCQEHAPSALAEAWAATGPLGLHT